MKGTNKLLSVALAGAIGLSMIASPVFAASGANQKNSGANSGSEINLNYKYLTIQNTTEFIGSGDTEVSKDVGYAWDDFSWTYVNEVNDVYRLTTDGHNKVDEQSTSTGAWYNGTLTEEQFRGLSADDKTAIQVNYNGENSIETTELEKTPKLVLHNYEDSSVNFNFKYNANDVDDAEGCNVAVFNSDGTKNATLSTMTASGTDYVTNSVSIESEGTQMYGIIPNTTPTEDFGTVSIDLTLCF